MTCAVLVSIEVPSPFDLTVDIFSKIYRSKVDEFLGYTYNIMVVEVFCLRRRYCCRDSVQEGCFGGVRDAEAKNSYPINGRIGRGIDGLQPTVVMGL